MKKVFIFFFILSSFISLKASNVISITDIVRQNKKNKKEKIKRAENDQTNLISMQKLRILNLIIHPSKNNSESDFDQIKDIIKENKGIENQFLTEKKETLVILAFKNRRYRILDFLLKENAQNTDVNIQDYKGQSALHHLLSLQNKQKPSVIFKGVAGSSHLFEDFLDFQDEKRKNSYLSKRNVMIQTSRRRMVEHDIIKINRLDAKARKRLFDSSEQRKHVYYQRDSYTFTLNNLYDLVNLDKLQANFDLKDHKGRTPLMIALNNPYLLGQDAIFKYLINRSDVNLKDHFGNTALYYALQSGNLQAFDLIHQKEADLDTYNDQKNNLLHESFLKLAEIKQMRKKQIPQIDKIKAKKDLEQMLFEENLINANIQTRDKPEVYPYDLIMEAAQTVGVEKIIIYLMAQKKTDLGLLNENGQLPIHILAKLGDLNLLTHLVRQMRSQGKNPLIKDHYGRTFLDQIESLVLRKQMSHVIKQDQYLDQAKQRRIIRFYQSEKRLPRAQIVRR